MGPVIRLFELPHHEARAVLRETDAPVYLTVNPVEFHGPHLPLWTDKIISEGLDRALHDALIRDHPDWPYIVADELAAGVEPAFGPGSRFTGYPHLRAKVVEACRALVELGARRVVLNTFHGHPLHNLALHRGVEAVRAAGGRAVSLLPIALHEMMSLDAERYAEVFDLVDADEETKAALKDGLRFDFHAGFFETSLVMHFAPGAVSTRHRELSPCPPLPRSRFVGALSSLAGRLGASTLATELDFLATASMWGSLRPFPGYTSWPSLASAEVGAWFAARLVERYAATAEAVLVRGEPPLAPPMPWLVALSLGGRLTEPKPPMDAVAVDPPGDEAASAAPRRAVAGAFRDRAAEP